MAGWTRVNLDEVEDSAPGGGLAPGLEARFAREPLGMEKGGLGYFRAQPGYRVPFGHTHTEQEEVYVLLSGSGRMKLDDEVIELRARDAVRVAPGVWRALEAGPEGAEMLAFGAPHTANQDGKVEPNWWSE